MGYNTEFEGEFRIVPPLDAATLAKLEEFCEERHGGDLDVFPGMPAFWCNWEFEDKGDHTEMRWNGSEKSYAMDEWAILLFKRFFPKHSVTGDIRARGEDFDDLWSMHASGGCIRRRDGW